MSRSRTTGNSRPVTVSRRAEQPYVAISRSVRRDGFASVAHEVPVVIGWAVDHGLELAGAPFFRYRTIDMNGESEVEAGVPVVSAPEPQGGIRVGMLPEGHYATLTHIGPPAGLVDATKVLLAWAHSEGMAWDMTTADGSERWGCRMESYKTDPRVEPDTAKWVTELAFRLANR